MKLHSGYGTAAIGYMVGIFLLSSTPEASDLATTLLANILRIPLFAGLAACVLLSLSGGEWSRVVPGRLYAIAGLLPMAYAAVDELHQSWVARGAGSVGDFLINTLGIAGLLVVHRLSRGDQRTQ